MYITGVVFKRLVKLIYMKPLGVKTKRRSVMLAYEFYVSSQTKERDLVGILPERRKHSRRITQKSIMKWGRLAAGSNVDPNSIYFIPVRIKK